MVAPAALITGIYGQDGSYMAERLLAEGWVVHGTFRPGSEPPRGVGLELAGVHLYPVDLNDEATVARVFREIQPSHVFHLAGVSSVGQSWKDPITTVRVNAVATTLLMNLAFAEQNSSGRKVVFVNASSSEIFGARADGALTESDPISPSSPYGASKAYAHQLGVVYRSRGLAVSNAVLFNHESPRRGTAFVTGKIARGAALVARGEMDHLSLGDMSACRDWGWAPDYVDAMFRMACAGTGQDFVVATGQLHSVREFAAAAFAEVGINDWERYVMVDETYLRPHDSSGCVGDASHARDRLGWAPTVEFEQIVGAMVHSQMDQLLSRAPNS